MDDRGQKGPTVSAAVDRSMRTGFIDSARNGFANGLDTASSGRARMPQAQAAAAERTILIAQDDAGFRTALHRYLESSGYRVVEAEDGSWEIRDFVCPHCQRQYTDRRAITTGACLVAYWKLHAEVVRVRLQQNPSPEGQRD